MRNRGAATDPDLVAVVICGGAGSRLWPLSTAKRPKQFHALGGPGSLLARTFLRARLAGAASVVAVGAAAHEGLLAAEARNAGGDVELLLEPAARNTAPALAVAARHVLRTRGNCRIIVMPADHHIEPAGALAAAIAEGSPAADAGAIVLFGIRPTRAETGYGYIETGARHALHGIAAVRRFVEKPDAATAERFLRSGRHRWNSGMFLANAVTLRMAFRRHAPAIWRAAADALAGAAGPPGRFRLSPEPYARLAGAAFDRAIVERSRRLAMVEAGFGWSDLGSWSALAAIGDRDDAGNVVVGDVVAEDCRNCYLRAEGRPLAVSGARDLVVVATAEATFAAPLAGGTDAGALAARLARPAGPRHRQESAPPPAPADWPARVRSWLETQALPLWMEAAVDRCAGGYAEALDFSARAIAGRRRMRTMARLLYAFARGAAQGFADKRAPAISLGLDFIATRGLAPDGGWVRSFGADGRVLDRTADAYDHACVLLALAEAHMLGLAGAGGLARRTFAYMVDRRPDWIGAASPLVASRSADSLMHVFEALLAWHRASGDADVLDRARSIASLVATRLYDAENWCIAERFAGDWRRIDGPAGVAVDPGHQFEWASLLAEFADRDRAPAYRDIAARLYLAAAGQGVDRRTGLAFAVVDAAGRPVDRATRSWRQCEAVRAAAVLDRCGRLDTGEETQARLEALFRAHLDPAPPGLWIDRLDEAARPRSASVPASILYHLVSTFTCYLAGTEVVPQRRQYGLSTFPVST